MQKLSETDKRNIVAARQAGTKVTDLAKKYDVDKSSIYNVLKAWEKSSESTFTSSETENEPASAATDTSSEQNIIPDNSADIIPENPENVKTPEVNPVEIDMSDTYEGDNVYRDMPIPPKEHTFSPAAVDAVDAVDAVYDCICRKQQEISELDENMTMLYAEIDRLNEQVNALNDMQMCAEAELDRLWKDYDNIYGGKIS